MEQEGTKRSVEDILENKKNYYETYRISKKTGGFRTIVAPKPELKHIQKTFWKCIEPFVEKELHPCVTGFRKGKSISDNATPHLNKEVILNIDIANFFPSIPKKWLIESMGYFLLMPRVKNWKKKEGLQGIDRIDLFELLTVNDELCQGSPCSPGLANLYLSNTGFDKKMTDEVMGKYTRYADDITISFKMRIPRMIMKEFIKEVYQELKKIELTPNFKKTKIRYRDQKQLVTGILVNGEECKIEKKSFRKAKSAIHQNGENAKNEGYISFVHSVNKGQSEKLSETIKE